MADIRALLTSNTAHYCTPPDVTVPMRKLLVPEGSGRRLGDFATNDAGRLLIRPSLYADGVNADGLTLRWSDASCTFLNPPYGPEIEKFMGVQSYWGREIGVPGVALVPARDDTQWCQRHVFGSADAWLHVEGRFAFWLVIPIRREDAIIRKDRDGKNREPYYLRRWFPAAEDGNLPAPFVSVSPGWAVGPELGENGKPQSAPFPSLIPFWADPETEERDPRAEVEALHMLVAEAAARLGPDADEWLYQADRLLGKRLERRGLDRDVFDRLAALCPKEKSHPISVRRFAQLFGHMGTLTIARGPHRGVYQR